MKRYLVVTAAVLMVGFLASSLWADSRRNPRARQGTRIGARRSGDHARQAYRQTYVTRPFVGVNRRYTTHHRNRYNRYSYRRPTYGNDRAFRVLPYRYYYGYSTPRYVTPYPYYYYYDTPHGGITFTWSW